MVMTVMHLRGHGKTVSTALTYHGVGDWLIGAHASSIGWVTLSNSFVLRTRAIGANSVSQLPLPRSLDVSTMHAMVLLHVYFADTPAIELSLVPPAYSSL